MNSEEEKYMERALGLAKLGIGSVSPNPMVGCVIVKDGLIIGEGYHQQYGGPHAEVNAVNSVEDKLQIKGSDVYVSLEPCSHFGKTPPCADLLVQHQPKKVIVCNVDPNPLVAGKGLEKLKKAGIEVITGVLEKQGLELNKRFFTSMTKQRPYIILKWAQTADGFVARKNFDSKWISNQRSRQYVHKWRAEEDAILVGSNTAKHDNPTLNVRDWSGKNPTRIVIDRNMKLSPKLNLFDGTIPTLCFNLSKNEEQENLKYIQLEEESFLKQVLEKLHENKLYSVIVEGGSQILHSLIKEGLWDEARIFTSETMFGEGIPAPRISGKLISKQPIHTDELKVYQNL
ncbi:bifunctional diaminohydroxyphosphoribosylaminopyrimidine deaminase/5-amino-6-(5-phosphoribosylamino)uracil reductase RibD [Flammeovirgaceae bacterium SG7u.111]|nr:bifunctional diaminohydroxyphosphoribosylaminopyrimidine deaminase/5-amino-6-(5-phosphoribosylamino)uracil reductase RibD [Flammeovirgaceae bacterium SG7u.132]WPO38125.1 bifunctional diaminohydroxyphosphoribosylaminopyrimidine deaminase/5-amino-6-(5-phosphoribosylamino)uracil reductase RibD [Flammeovirgaceae bacterium SG7u.111]